MCQFLVKLHQSESFGWPIPFYEEIGKIAFVPCYDFSKMSFIPSLFAQKLPQFKSWEEVKVGGKDAKKKAKNSMTRFTRNVNSHF